MMPVLRISVSSTDEDANTNGGRGRRGQKKGKAVFQASVDQTPRSVVGRDNDVPIILRSGCLLSVIKDDDENTATPKQSVYTRNSTFLPLKAARERKERKKSEWVVIFWCVESIVYSL